MTVEDDLKAAIKNRQAAEAALEAKMESFNALDLECRQARIDLQNAKEAETAAQAAFAAST